MKKSFLGYRLGNVTEDPRFPYYGVFRPDGTQCDTLRFSSDFKDAVLRDIWEHSEDVHKELHLLTPEICKRHAFVNAIFQQGSSYRCDDTGADVAKTWNRGMGRLAFIKLYIDKKIILVNKCLYNKHDERHLRHTMEILGMSDWDVQFKAYGYPDYYNHSFHL